MKSRWTWSIVFLVTCLCAAARAANPPDWDFQKECWPELVRSVPEILRSQDRKTGRFGSGIWIVNDQNVVFPLAVAWATQHADNPHYRRPEVLEAIMAGGDALIDDQDAKGQWEFRKKDGSTWGKTYMPWTYSRWVRAFGLIRDAMPPERRARWERALTLGYEGIAKSALASVHNIPTHHAMGLYQAGRALNRPEWCTQAQAFMAKVCQAQHPDGYWSENSGPVVAYNFVYTDALGTYHAMSGDTAVLPALQRSARFHAAFTYPDGTRVETIDQRNPYETDISAGTVGFTRSAGGRRFLQRQWQRIRATRGHLNADDAASFLLYGQTGPLEAENQGNLFVLGKNDALTQSSPPWFACLSAFHCDVVESRWIQDRQNLVSLFHRDTGLIVGGGNTKLQPRWSTFVVGDVALLSHRAGDTNPKFTPPAGLRHVPSQATLDPEQLHLGLVYGIERCSVRVHVSDGQRATLTYETEAVSGQAVTAHVPLLAHVGEIWETASGKREKLTDAAFALGPGETGEWFAHHGWRITVPTTATIVWPALPHNPYRKDGHAKAHEGRLVVILPFDNKVHRHTVTVEAARPVSPRSSR